MTPHQARVRKDLITIAALVAGYLTLAAITAIVHLASKGLI